MTRTAARLAALLTLPTAAGCVRPTAGRPEPPPAPVTVATAERRTVPVRVRTIGTVKAVATVAVRPRVGGQLTGVHFREGDFVEEGQKLFTIDPRPYEAAVRQAEANKARNVALQKGADRELERVERLLLAGTGSATEHDAAVTAAASAKAAVEADQAALETAKIQLSFTAITAPIAGRVGELLVSGGNLVEANGANPLVVINQIDPIQVTFTLPEQRLPVVVAARRRGPLRVEAALRGGGAPAVGELAFVDNAADPLTGTVQFKATFPNADRRLWPGLFVDVALTLGERPDSVVVPAAAVQAGQQGQYVYAVTPEKTAVLKRVTVAFEDGREAVVAGLDGGESVVVEGQLRLAPGVTVDPRPLPPAGPPAAAPAVPRVVAGGRE